ncbi:MAG: pyridoxal 5'-phosphate synthase glutaminase subunit PdxT [Halobacteriales archaeon]|nr:pyridoxal 5'-phosphate synthase glutaminase subunit PdxT [Halobacteriales archaeon]
MSLLVGVVGVQGDVSEHEKAFRRAGEALGFEIETVAVRDSGTVPDCDVVALPGGESTTISRLLRREGIDDELREHIDAGKPTLATCAGLIILDSPDDERVASLGVLDVQVKRNAFGGQRESFEADIDIEGLEKPFHAVFIRAPVVESVGEDVDVLAEFDGNIVAVRQENVIGTAFHPELTDDHRLHELLLEEM